MLQPYSNILFLFDCLYMLQKELVATELASLDKYPDSKYWEKKHIFFWFIWKITSCYRIFNAELCFTLKQTCSFGS